MNLTRALDVALPEIPARSVSQRVPRLDPGATFREHLEDGNRIVRVYTPSSGYMYKLSPAQWTLAKLFDGNRSYSEIAAIYTEQTGEYYDQQAIVDFSGELEAAGFWYSTPQEKNILLLLQTKEERRKNLKAKNRFADLSIIIFPAFNPDRGLNWIYSYTKFIYTRWFTVLTVLAFIFTAAITISRWSEIGHDTVQFYNFSDKSFADILVLYALGMFVVAVHEYAHAHACKHCGGRVTAMGFALVFLTPAFYTDTTEGAVMGDRQQRLVISLAGIWAELMVCSIATPIWWLSEPNTIVHDGAYFMMMLTGIVSLIVNWNPLIKLDGYHMLCEIIGIAELKEDSTAYLSAWVRRHLWRLPVEVPYVPKRRRLGFATYALLSGAYSYMVLYVVARFAGNVSRNFSPEWAFIPEYGVALVVFKSRIRLLVNFMKLVYLDKKDRVRAWLGSHQAILVAVLVVAFLLLPIWHQSTSGNFVLEPAKRAVVHSVVPGMVEDILVREGSVVSAGQPLATLHNLPMQSDLAEAQSQFVVASDRATSAALHYEDYGTATQERESAATKSEQLQLKTANLSIVSPISGVVLTPRLQNRVGSYLTEGTDLLEIADLNTLRARIYVSEYDMYKVREGASAKLRVEGVAQTWNTHATAISPVSQETDPTLVDTTKFKGLHPPQFYLVQLLVSSGDGRLKPGMSGVARIYGKRISLAGLGLESLRIALGRKIW
jgi:putative peptide zinc metalloprotease protein